MLVLPVYASVLLSIRTGRLFRFASFLIISNVLGSISFPSLYTLGSIPLTSEFEPTIYKSPTFEK